MSAKSKVLARMLGVSMVLLGKTSLAQTASDGPVQAQGVIQEQLRAFASSVQKETDQLKSRLIRVVEKRELGLAENEVDEELGPFLNVSLLKVVGGEKPQLRWKLEKKNSPTTNWPTAYLDGFFAKAPHLGLNSNPVYLGYLPSPQAVPFFQFLLKAQLKLKDQPSAAEVVVFGILKDSPFLNLVSQRKNAPGNFSILNYDGLVLAHSLPEFVGKSWMSDPYLENLLKNPRPSSLDMVKDNDGNEVMKATEMINGGNLLAYVEVPEDAFGGGGMKVQPWLLLLGVLLIAGALGVFWRSGSFSRWIKPKEPVASPLARSSAPAEKKLPSEAPAKSAVAEPPPPSGEFTGSSIIPTSPNNRLAEASSLAVPDTDKMGAYTQLSAALINEMKSPLLTILGYTQIAKSKATDEATRNHYELIEKEARQSKELIDKLGLFAGLNPGAKEEFYLLDLVQDVVRIYRRSCEEKGISLEVKVPDHLKIEGQRGHLRLALSYLVENSIDAIEAASLKTLTLSAQSLGDQIQLEIADSGDGIPDDIKEKVFEPFFSRRTGKKGLGLSSAAGIIKHHFGKIEIKKNDPRGTIVVLNLPKKQPLVNLAEQGVGENPTSLSHLGLEIEEKLNELLKKADEALTPKPQHQSQDPAKVDQAFNAIKWSLKKRENRREIGEDESVFLTSDQSEPLILLDYLQHLKDQNMLEVEGSEVASAKSDEDASDEKSMVIESYESLAGDDINEAIKGIETAPLKKTDLSKSIPNAPIFHSTGLISNEMVMSSSDIPAKKEIKKLAKPKGNLMTVKSKVEDVQVNVRRPIGKA